MKQIVYIGYYGGGRLKTRDLTDYNLAGTAKMQFIIQCLKKLGCSVLVLSLATDKTPGYHPAERVDIDDRESYVYLPFLGIRTGRGTAGSRSAVFYLKRYLEKNLTEDSVVVSYHSLGYGKVLQQLHRRIGFRWCPQIEEIYCLSRGELKAPEYLKREEEMFRGGDGFLFVNDLLAEKYAQGKPYAVSYGNYHVFSEAAEPPEDRIRLVYTGIINADRGAFLLPDAVELLPDNYDLNVLGYGTEENMRAFLDRAEALNRSSGRERIRLCGTRSGREYTEFLRRNQIGISLMDDSEDISANAFPSKIMAYLGHGLYVVASGTESVRRSRVADMLNFCENTPESVAETVLSVPVREKCNAAGKLRELEAVFLQDLRRVLENS